MGKSKKNLLLWGGGAEMGGWERIQGQVCVCLCVFGGGGQAGMLTMFKFLREVMGRKEQTVLCVWKCQHSEPVSGRRRNRLRLNAGSRSFPVRDRAPPESCKGPRAGQGCRCTSSDL